MRRQKSTSRPAAKYSKLSDRELVRFIMQQNNEYCLALLTGIQDIAKRDFYNEYSAVPLFRHLEREIKQAKIIKELHDKGIKCAKPA